MVVWDEAFTYYNFGPTHPMAPIRLALTARLAYDLGLFDLPNVTVHVVDPATDEQLQRVHDAAYIDKVKAASADPENADPSTGLEHADNPAFVGIHETSARIFGAGLQAARSLIEDDVQHAVNFCGGMHHAMHDRASGFCVYNDLAATIHELLDNGFDRVAYVDIDAHHGDGTEALFWDDPRVMTISLHETGRSLFPGTGFPDDMGGTNAEGIAVNVALPPGTSDRGWLRAIHSVVHPLVREFRPQVLVTQHGADSHYQDPLAHLNVSVDGQRLAAESLHDLAHEVCDGRWIATGGGGYELVDVVPRAWAHLIAIAAHHPIEPETPVPQGWRDHVAEVMGGSKTPETMTDGQDPWWQSWEIGYDPQDAVDRAIMATRQKVFPLHGLDPWFD